MPPRPELRDRRRAEILAAARALVVKEGLEALTIGALESRLSFTRGVITYHFENKDEIVESLLDEAVAEIDAALRHSLEGAPGFRAKIRAVVITQCRGFLAHEDAARILLAFWGRLHPDPRARRLNARLFAGYRAQAASLVAEGKKRGLVPDDVDPATAGAMLVGLVVGVVAQVYFDPAAIDVDAAVEEAAEMAVARLVKRRPAGGS